MRSRIPLKNAIGNGSFQMELVGEGFYLKNIKSLLNIKKGDTVIDGFNIILKFDNHNDHDPNAVAATIQQKIVGYLPRDKAITHRRLIRSLGYNEAALRCKAKAFRAKGTKNWGIWLDYDFRLTKRGYTNA
jgi:hypothetical protein